MLPAFLSLVQPNDHIVFQFKNRQPGLIVIFVGNIQVRKFRLSYHLAMSLECFGQLFRRHGHVLQMYSSADFIAYHQGLEKPFGIMAYIHFLLPALLNGNSSIGQDHQTNNDHCGIEPNLLSGFQRVSDGKQQTTS